MHDSTKRRGDCLPAGCCPSTQQWREQRYIYSLNDIGGELLQPSRDTLLLTADPDGKDPGIAVVSLHSIASVRNLQEVQNTPTMGEIRTASRAVPIAENHNPALSPAVNPRNTGRGVAVPQYRVTFADGSTDNAVVYSDGNCILSHPASQVLIEVLTTPELLYTGDGIAGLPALLRTGLIVDAIVAASVAWGEKDGDAAPFGMTTWSQLIGGVGGTLVLFERPPFARRVLIIPPIGVAAFFDFRSSPTNVIAIPPAIANTLQRPQDIPAAATHVAATLAPAAPPGTLVNCIWEIGVR